MIWFPHASRVVPLCYRQPDSAAYVLEKVAKLLEEQAKDNYSSAVLLEKAVEIVETENRPLQAAHYQTKLLQMDLDNDQLNEFTLEKARKLVYFYQVRMQSGKKYHAKIIIV